MKKQIKNLGLKKQTISSLEARLVNGGAPTTMTVNTFASGCQSQLPCAPIPAPLPPKTNPSYSNCGECTMICGN
jgi:hypothetical protein